MAPQPYGKSNDGPRITVNALLKNPRTLPGRIVRMLDQQFITDAVLRNAGGTPSGAVVYEESAPQFAENDPEVIQEGSNYPITRMQVGERKVTRTVKRGFALQVTEEMRMRNDIDAVNKGLTQTKNNMIRLHEDTFLALFLANASVPTDTVSAAWDVPTTVIRNDIADAILTVQNAAVEDRPDDFLGYEPDTLIISNTIATALLKSDDIAKVFIGNLADEAPQYKGTMPATFFGLRILKSRRINADQGILLQRNVVGGIVDERPLRATPMRENQDNETWKSNISRISAMFVDNPKAAIVLNGLAT